MSSPEGISRELHCYSEGIRSKHSCRGFKNLTAVSHPYVINGFQQCYNRFSAYCSQTRHCPYLTWRKKKFDGRSHFRMIIANYL